MTLERHLPPPRRKLECVDRQEERTWARFYPQARCDATLAQELLMELERDDLLRRRHRGLYLSCQRCIRLHDLRQARNERIGRLVRAVMGSMFIIAPQALYRGMRHMGQLFLACLPQEDADDPGRSWLDRTGRLLERDAYAQGGQTLRVRARKAADKASNGLDTSEAGSSTPRPPAAMAKSSVD